MCICVDIKTSLTPFDKFISPAHLLGDWDPRGNCIGFAFDWNVNGMRWVECRWPEVTGKLINSFARSLPRFTSVLPSSLFLSFFPILHPHTEAGVCEGGSWHSVFKALWVYCRTIAISIDWRRPLFVWHLTKNLGPDLVAVRFGLVLDGNMARWMISYFGLCNYCLFVSAWMFGNRKCENS